MGKELKFKLTGESMVNFLGIKLFRIEATVSFGGVSEGDKGGWVESAEVDGDARVFGNAWVFGDAQVFGNARVFGDAQVFGNAWVFGDARVFGNAWVFGDALDTGWCFAYKDKSWDVTEVPTKDGKGFLLIRDYKAHAADAAPDEIEVDGVKYIKKAEDK
jgi:hypothetical protein